MKRKINQSAVLAFSFAAFMTLWGSAPTAGASEQALSMPAARSAARATAWEVARRNPLVNSVKLQTCERRGPQAIHCLALDRGSTSLKRTTCRVWVNVRSLRGRPTGSLKLVSCKTDRLVLLTAAEAEAAMRARLQEIAGPSKEVVVSPYARGSRTVVLGSGGWMHPDRIHPSEICNAVLRATLSDGEVQVTVDNLSCSNPTS